MNINMNDDSIGSIAQLQALIKVNNGLKFSSEDKEGTYKWINETLGKFGYFSSSKKEKGVVKRYLVQMTGYSEGNIDKLIAKKKKAGRVALKTRTQFKFPRRYTLSDIDLLADVCNAYQGQNGIAIKKMLGEMVSVYGDSRFERLSKISVGHFYNLKKSRRFKDKSLVYTKTNPTTVPIGERRKPNPYDKPGFIRVDSVHQGDLDKQKGVYHINLVDEVTQVEIAVAVEKISEYYLIPALVDALDQFPFKILNFHSDNGSEYINKRVSKLLGKLQIEQTKSRSRKSNDNALVEGKNGALIRRYMGHGYIPQEHAGSISSFYKQHLNPFINHHRFCAFPVEQVDDKGKVKKNYPLDKFQTPIQKLLSLPNVEEYLVSGVSVDSLRNTSLQTDHFTAAKAVVEARTQLFREIKNKHDIDKEKN